MTIPSVCSGDRRRATPFSSVPRRRSLLRHPLLRSPVSLVPDLSRVSMAKMKKLTARKTTGGTSIHSPLRPSGRVPAVPQLLSSEPPPFQSPSPSTEPPHNPATPVRVISKRQVNGGSGSSSHPPNVVRRSRFTLATIRSDHLTVVCVMWWPRRSGARRM